jgi:hypothetical protein
LLFIIYKGVRNDLSGQKAFSVEKRGNEGSRAGREHLGIGLRQKELFLARLDGRYNETTTPVSRSFSPSIAAIVCSRSLIFPS